MAMRWVMRNRGWCLFTAAMVVLAVACFPWRRPAGVRLEELFAAESSPLRARVHLDFDDVRLGTVFEALGREAGCRITPAWEVLKTREVERDTPVVAHARGTVTLEGAITTILLSFDGPQAWTPDPLRNWRRDRSVVVEGGNEARAGLVTVVYDVSDLVYRADFEEQENQIDVLVGLMDGNAGGLHGRMGLVSDSLGAENGSVVSWDDKLVVRASRESQRRVAEVLVQLRGS